MLASHTGRMIGVSAFLCVCEGGVVYDKTNFFVTDDGSPVSRRGSFMFGWEHTAPVMDPDQCNNGKTDSLHAGVSFPEPRCGKLEECDPLVDCRYPNFWSIEMPSYVNRTGVLNMYAELL